MQYDIAIIGGGVVGCSIFDRLTLAGYKCVLFEQGGDVGVGMSKANSGLVHAGFDCQPGTLKAKLNVRGHYLMKQTCERLGVPLKFTGAIVVGDNIKTIREIYKRGIKNEVKKIRVVHRTMLRTLVPNIANTLTCGLYAPMAGVVSPYLLTIALAEEGIVNGGKVLLNNKVTSIFKDNDAFLIHSTGADEYAKVVINAAGAGYNDVARMIGAETYKTDFVRGEYFILDKSEQGIVDLTVFPTPSAVSKGVMITPAADGVIIVGPNAEDSNTMTLTTAAGLNEVKERALSLIPNLDFSKNIRNFAGVRVKVGHDFIIEESKTVPNVINIAGIASPGLTAAPAIAEMVETFISQFGTASDLSKVHITGKLPNGDNFIPREPYYITSEMSKKKLNALIEKDKRYGKIVCRCEQVTLGEIAQAIRSPLKPNTVDAIKRRTRAGMGRCQGGFCLDRVIEEIAQETGLPYNKINKENAGSNLIVGDIKPTKRGDK